MFVNVSPTDADAPETVCSLSFASRVRGVELGAARKNVVTDSGGGSEAVKELKAVVAALQEQVGLEWMDSTEHVLLCVLLGKVLLIVRAGVRLRYFGGAVEGLQYCVALAGLYRHEGGALPAVCRRPGM